MKKLTILIIIFIGILSCSTLKKVSENENGIKQKTANPNTPYIYKNGFKDFNIVSILTIQGKDSSYINELRYNAVAASMYTKKVMFDKFGKWDKEIRPNNERHPILVWEKVKLFNDNDKIYSVATSGVESIKEIYASVMVFNNNTDCLAKNNPKKDSIINFFSSGIVNLSFSNKFYKIYWKMINEYEENK